MASGQYIFFGPYQECRASESDFNSALALVNREIKTNNIVLGELKNDIELLSTESTMTIQDKQQNLKTVANLKFLEVEGLAQSNTFFLTLPREIKGQYNEVYYEVKDLYDNYLNLNESINLMKSSVVASLGFRADLFSKYLPSAKNDLSDSFQIVSMVDTGELLKKIDGIVEVRRCRFW